MKQQEIEHKLREVQTWQRATIGCRDSFIIQMRGCNYGREELIDAWSWYHAGWDECIKVNRIKLAVLKLRRYTA